MKNLKLMTFLFLVSTSQIYANSMEKYTPLFNEEAIESLHDYKLDNIHEDELSPCENDSRPIKLFEYIKRSYFGRDFLKVANIIQKNYSLSISSLNVLNSKYIVCVDKVKADQESLYFQESNHVNETSKYYGYDHILNAFKEDSPVRKRSVQREHALKLFESILIAELGDKERASEIIQEVTDLLK